MCKNQDGKQPSIKQHRKNCTKEYVPTNAFAQYFLFFAPNTFFCLTYSKNGNVLAFSAFNSFSRVCRPKNNGRRARFSSFATNNYIWGSSLQRKKFPARAITPPNRAVNLHIKKLRPQKKNGIARTHSAKKRRVKARLRFRRYYYRVSMRALFAGLCTSQQKSS